MRQATLGRPKTTQALAAIGQELRDIIRADAARFGPLICALDNMAE